ncbi:hypothetical protein BsWGS_27095 [Bradybaena similaris]
MSTQTDGENMSPGTQNRNMSADTTPGSSSADTETDHLFPEAESKDASRETTIDNPSVDMDSTVTSDTLTLARLDRENQGTWEAEYSYGGEADLHRHYDGCTKNPGHKNFISVDKFSIEDLPEGYRDKDVMDYIQIISDLTVRVTAKYVSDKRPETDDVSGKPFPGYSYRGQRRTTVGTGRVNCVSLGHEENNYETCKCKECLTSSNPQTEYGTINISTARHVVYDESEATHTTCHLYFDREGTPETCEGVVALSGMSRLHDYHEIDGYWMVHYTHDMDLAHRLKQRCEQRIDLLTKIWGKLPCNWNLKWSRPAPDKQPLLFIVSHPHGCSKQISIGRCHSMFSLTDNQWGYTYTTATCPGSSGARVYVLHKCMRDDLVKCLSQFPPVHHGVYDRQLEINLSLFDEG